MLSNLTEIAQGGGRAGAPAEGAMLWLQRSGGFQAGRPMLSPH